MTACTQVRKECFGEMKDGAVMVNEYGEIVLSCWYNLPDHYSNLILDQFIVMPNHVHGILVIDNDVGNGLKPFPTKKHGLSEFVRAFKTFSSRRINERLSARNGFKPIRTKFQWQKSFYDHIIRDEYDLTRVREYIHNNPLKWEEDEENVNQS